MLSSESLSEYLPQEFDDKKTLSSGGDAPAPLALNDNIHLITSPSLHVGGGDSDLRATARRALELAEAKDSKNTRRAYESDLKDFTQWCAHHGLVALPAEPQTIALYITTLADRCKFATIRRRLVAINRLHHERGLTKVTAHPMVRDILKGTANTKGTAQRQKSALTAELLSDAIATLDTSLRGNRDRSILLLGFAGAFRRSEIAGLLVSDLRFNRQGLTVTLRRSKTDQQGQGREIGIPSVRTASLCPVRAVKAWLDQAHVTDGFVFRTIVGGSATTERIADAAVARLVKRVAGDAGLDGDFGGHSLRAGFVTSADSKGASAVDIMRVTGHKSRAMLDKYARKANVFEDAPLSKIFR